MTPQEINKRIWLWLNADHTDHYECYDGELPDYYNTNVAFDLLDVLVERGYEFNLCSICEQWEVQIFKVDINGHTEVFETMRESKSQAICEAVIKLIGQEVKV